MNSNTADAADGKLSHIMVSYQWDVQDEVLRVVEILRNAGYRVWIDVAKMSGNSLESMVKAVENAAVVVPVLTEKYMSSETCRQEFSYANQLRKKMVPLRLQPKYLPDGWLGLALGDTFFYDLTDPNKYEKNISNFLKELGSDGKIKPAKDVNLSYGYKHAMNSNSADAVDGEESKELTPHAPKEPDLPTPDCMTDGSNAQLPRDFIEKWKVTDSGVEKRMKEVGYTLNLLMNQDINDLVQNSKSYDRDFYLLSKGMYKLHNSKYANRKLLLQTLLDEDIITFLKVYWAAIMKEFNAKKAETGSSLPAGELWEKYTTTQPHIVDALGNCYYILVVLWNGSNMRLPETLKTLYNSMVLFLLELLNKDLHPVKVKATHPQYKMVQACLGVIQNFCSKYEGAVVDLRGKGALDIVSKYRDSGSLELKAKIVFFYSCLLPKDDQKNLSFIKLKRSDIDFLLDVLRDALNDSDDFSGKFGFYADEVIVGLNNIAVIDSNKKRLVDAGVLPLYVEAMNRNEPNLQSSAAQGVLTLNFDLKRKLKIKWEPGCIDVLRKLTESMVQEVRSTAEGALWKLGGKTKQLQLTPAQKRSKKSKQEKQLHIMISYQWDVKDEVLRVRGILGRADYRVWIDVEQMSGNTLESIAKAVENAAVVVPVLTEKYKASVACRQELSYAAQLKKKMVPLCLQPEYSPDGWLGLAVGDTFIHDLTDPQKYDERISGFLNALGDDAKIAKGVGGWLGRVAQ